MPSIAEKTLAEKARKKLLSSFQITKSTQTSESIFAHRNEQFEKTKFDSEIIKNVDCFLDGHVIYTSNLTSTIRKPIAIKNTKTKMIVPNVRQTHATYSWKNFLPQAVVISSKVFLHVGTTLITFHQESEKTT